MLLALALQAGAAFMLPGVAPGLNLLADAQQGAVPWPLSLASCALAFLAAAGWWLAWSQVLGWRGWRGWRRWPMGVAAAVFVLLSWALPTLGATLWVACFASITHRRKRAVLAAVAAGWIISASYYALSWTLQTKALVMAGAGATLLLTALLWLRRERWASAVPGSPPAPETSLAATNAPPPGALGMESAHWRWALPMLCVLCATALAALTVWRYEALLASGRVALFELAPVDPRSLAQGDYMALAWRMPDDMQKALEGRATVDRPLAATRRDSHDVLTLSRLVADSGALGEGEELIELSPKGGRWVLVTDAWFFKEGEAERWAAARYGEFRLMPNGKALLVGLRDEARRKL